MPHPNPLSRFASPIAVLLVDFGDFLDGVLARYWIKILPPPVKPVPPSPVPTPILEHRTTSWGAYADAVLDKAYLIPVWIYCISTIPPLTWFSTLFTHFILVALILTETYSAFVRTKSFYVQTGVLPLQLEVPSTCTTSQSVTVSDASSIFSSSSIKADAVGKCKQTLQMSGTALVVACEPGGWGRLVGLVVLALATPLSVESVKRKTRTINVAIMVEGKGGGGSEGWLEEAAGLTASVKGLASSISVVGDGVGVMKYLGCVDYIVTDKPKVVDEGYLESIGCEYVVIVEGGEWEGKVEVGEGRLIVVGKDGRGRRGKGKGGKKD